MESHGNHGWYDNPWLRLGIHRNSSRQAVASRCPRAVRIGFCGLPVHREPMGSPILRHPVPDLPGRVGLSRGQTQVAATQGHLAVEFGFVVDES